MTQPISINMRNQWINRVGECLRKDNVVYLVTLKCASTFYRKLLANNGWQPTQFSSIDWQQDHVFSFIMEPWARRAKGIAEDLLTYYSVEQYLLNNLGKRFWDDHLTFGPHSMPITLTWSGYVDKIDWIPLDSTVESNVLLDKLLELHGITLDYSSANSPHRSDQYKQEVFERISMFTESGSNCLQLMLAGDLDLYRTVLQRMNPKGETWAEISWLRSNV
jgi:hypothetical protein